MSEIQKPVRARRRPVVSCEECRRRKIKCDRTHPCKHCLQLKILCNYSDGVVPLNGQDTLTATTRRAVQPPNPNSAIPTASSPHEEFSVPGILIQHPQLPGTSLNSSNIHAETSGDSPKVRALLAKVQTLEQLLLEYMPGGAQGKSTSPVPKKPPAKMRGTFSKTRVFGQTHWMNFIGLFDTIANVRDNLSTPSFNDGILMTNVPALLTKCKAMAKSSKLKIYGEWLANPDIRASIPPAETCKILLEAYFRTSESAFRIFHIPTFWKEYEQYRREPLLASDSFVLKMLLAIAIGIMFYQEPDFDELRAQAKKWIYAAQSWLAEIPYEKIRLNIAGIQIHCLLLLARQSLAVVDDQVWMSAGLLVRRAISIGLHRDPKHFPNMNLLQGEIRKRLWATVIELNVQFSVESGMRPLISCDDFDTEAPSNIDDENIDDDTTSLPSKPNNVFTKSIFQIILLSSLKTRMEIIQVCNRLSSEPSYEEVSKLGEIMIKECRASSSFVRKLQSSKADSRPTQLQCNTLDVYLRRFILILYSMFATKSQDDPRHYFSRKIALDASITMLSYPSNESGLKQSLKDLPYDDYTCLKTRSGSFFENIITHSMMIIFFELVTQLKEQDSFIEQNRELRQPLKNILYDACDVIAVRISVAENNVKGHLLFSAALGQIEAMEAGASPYQGAIDGAKRSVDMCFGLLADKEPIFASEAENTPQHEMGFDMQDWGLDFVMPDAWLSSGWDDGLVDNQNL